MVVCQEFLYAGVLFHHVLKLLCGDFLSVYHTGITLILVRLENLPSISGNEGEECKADDNDQQGSFASDLL